MRLHGDESELLCATQLLKIGGMFQLSLAREWSLELWTFFTRHN